MTIKIQCKDEMVDISELKPHPKNPQKHSEEQVERLAKLFSYQGIRHPIVVSTLTNRIVAGHGRLEAAQLLGMEKFPVSWQEFNDEDHEYSFMVSDNAIQQTFAEMDLGKINVDIQEMDGINFDIDLLGIKDFVIEPMDKFEIPKEKELDENVETKNECPSCSYRW